MIDLFNEAEVRKSGVIYNSVLEQIKRIHLMDPDKAGELAISAIELVLTGQISSDDPMIDALLQPLLVMRDKDENEYNLKQEAANNKKIVELKLREIAELHMSGCSQAQIGERLGIKQQTISYRLNVIRSKYPELLQKNGEIFTKIPKNSTKEKLVEVGNYQNTKSTKFVQNEKVGDFVELVKDKEVGEERSVSKKEFIF